MSVSPVTVTESHNLDDLIQYGFNYFIVDIENNITLGEPVNYLGEGIMLTFSRKDTNVLKTCSIFGTPLLTNQVIEFIYHDNTWYKNKYTTI